MLCVYYIQIYTVHIYIYIFNVHQTHHSRIFQRPLFHKPSSMYYPSPAMDFLLGLIPKVCESQQQVPVPNPKPTRPPPPAAPPPKAEIVEVPRIEVHVYLPSGRHGILRLTKAKPDLRVGDLKRAAQQLLWLSCWNRGDFFVRRRRKE